MAREEPPKIHTVTELYRILRDKTKFQLPESLEEQIYILNKYYTISRYPDAANGLPSESVARIEAERALRIAEEITNYVRSFVGDKA